jgi:hypothetical protein
MAANDLSLEVGANEVSAFEDALGSAGGGQRKSFTPLEDAHDDYVSLNGYGISTGGMVCVCLC